jgi:CRP/FNR family transcriptional regulator
MNQTLEIISGTPLFRGLPENHLREIKQIAVDRYFGKGKPIFLEGDEGNGFFIIVDGRVKIYKVSSEGKEQILHIFGPGEPFGEVPVFSGQRFPANAETLSKSHLLFFPRTAFIELITKKPSLSLNMLAILSMRLREFTVQVENLSLKEVPGRLASYLIYLVDEQEKKDCVTLNISKGQLASLLGTIPETLSRIFAKMTEQNLIAVKGRTIRLIDLQGLAAVAGKG